MLLYLYMKQIQKILAILLLAGLFFVPLSPTLSATTSTDFNPNYLISGAEMQDSQSMNQAEVQLFLTQYNSALANMLLPDLNGIIKKPSEIICNATIEHKINPKYLLVKLQKEQSLITETSPSQKQLDGATGYGITDGCGWDCEMYKNNQGFGKQVDSAAGIIRWYYDNKNANDWIKKSGISYLIDGATIIPANDATAFLYTYTPHLHGNQNFWNLWQSWFTVALPDGSLVKSVNSPAVYIIQNGKKRAITSMSVLASRFNANLIMTIPEAELSNYSTGLDISLPNYSILKNGDKYYLIDFDSVRPFASYDVVKKLGYNPGEFMDVTDTEISGYAIGSTINLDTTNPTGRIVKVKETNGLYYLKDGFYQPIYNEGLAKANFPNLKIETVAQVDLQNYQPGQIMKYRDGVLISVKGSKTVYVMEKGKKRPIASEEVFNGFGYNKKNIIIIDEIIASLHETGATVYLPGRMAAITNVDALSEPDDQESGIIENGKMLKAPEKNVIYVGDKINTKIDAYLIADYTTGKILAGKNIDFVRPMASFTKMMTAYRLMSEGLKLYSATTYNSKYKAKSGNFRAVNGEIFNNKDLMYALLVSSINTPARLLVSAVEKSETQFIARMNKQAKDWGLKKTKFTDTYGYDLSNVTTARDFLTLYKNSERVGDIRQILGAKDYVYNETRDLDSKPKHFDNHSNLLANKPGLPFKIISSKTGYLDESGAGLVMLIERPSDGKQFIIITMGNPDYKNRFVEPERLANWSLTNF